MRNTTSIGMRPFGEAVRNTTSIGMRPFGEAVRNTTSIGRRPFGEAQSKAMKAYAQSGEYHTIAECRDS